MFDIGPSELLLCAVVALVVIGPKDLPRVMRMVGHWAGRARGMARHFRSGIDGMMREAELEEMQKKWAAENARIMAEHPMLPDPDGPEAYPASVNTDRGEGADNAASTDVQPEDGPKISKDRTLP